MAITLASAEEQYKKFPKLDRDEVVKLQDWYEKQPHTPNVTGNYLISLIFNNDSEKNVILLWRHT